MVFSFASNFEFSAASMSTACPCSGGVSDAAGLAGPGGVLDVAGLPAPIPALHAALYGLGEFDHRFRPEHRRRHWPSPWSKGLGTPNSPAIRFTRGTVFAATLVRNCYGLSGCWPPLHGSDRSPSHRGLLLPGFRRIGHPPRRWI